jgi:hypothetical protein
MTHYESAIDDIAARLPGTDASLTASIAPTSWLERCRS